MRGYQWTLEAPLRLVGGLYLLSMRQTLLPLIELREGSKNEGEALGVHVEEDFRPILLPVRGSTARPFESGDLPIANSVKVTIS